MLVVINAFAIIATFAGEGQVTRISWIATVAKRSDVFEGQFGLPVKGHVGMGVAVNALADPTYLLAGHVAADS